MDYDVFNGDADGILSLVQLRLSDPRDAKLVTGRKRDIKLLERVPAKKNDRVTVLDISMRSYGDNFPDMAERLASGHDLPLAKLKSLGEMLNYNGYGGSEADLHFHPADLYREMAGFKTPMTFLSEKPEVIGKLLQGYADDFRMADGSKGLRFPHVKGQMRSLYNLRRAAVALQRLG